MLVVWTPGILELCCGHIPKPLAALKECGQSNYKCYVIVLKYFTELCLLMIDCVLSFVQVPKRSVCTLGNAWFHSWTSLALQLSNLQSHLLHLPQDMGNLLRSLTPMPSRHPMLRPHLLPVRVIGIRYRWQIVVSVVCMCYSALAFWPSFPLLFCF